MDVNDDMKKVEQLSAVKVSNKSNLCCFLHANILNCMGPLEIKEECIKAEESDTKPEIFYRNLPKISRKTKAILVPNLIGNVPDWSKLRKIAKKHNLMIIEDLSLIHI